MNYLNIDHIEFKNNPPKRQAAKRILFKIALEESEQLVIEFDKEELEKDAGKDYFYNVFPELEDVKKDALGYSVSEVFLRENKKQFLLEAFSTDAQIQAGLFFNYVKTARLIADEKTILRSGDHATFLLFDFTDAVISGLITLFSDLGIPFEAIEDVDVDMGQLYP